MGRLAEVDNKFSYKSETAGLRRVPELAWFA